MRRKHVYSTGDIALATVFVWLVGCSLYFYYLITSFLARPDNYGYERWLIFPVFGFLVQLPFLAMGLVVVILVEVIWLEARRREVLNSPGLL